MERSEYQRNLIAKTDKRLFKLYEDFLDNLTYEKLVAFRSEIKWMLEKVQTERAATTTELLKSWGFDMNKVTWLQYFGFVAHFHEDKPYIWNYDSNNYKVISEKCYFTFDNLLKDLDGKIKDREETPNG